VIRWLLISHIASVTTSDTKSIELKNKLDAQSEIKSETKAVSKCIGSDIALETDSEKFWWRMEQNLLSHQEGPFKAQARGGDRLGSRLTPHFRIQLAKTRNCSQVPLPRGQGRAARPPFGDSRVPSTVPRQSWRGLKEVNFGGPSTHVFRYTFLVIFGLRFWCPPEHRHPFTEKCFLRFFGELAAGALASENV
jgi:hypothetical protein